MEKMEFNQFIQDNYSTKKVIFSNNGAEVLKLVRMANDENISCINFQATTLYRYALEGCRLQIVKAGLTVLENREAINIIQNIMLSESLEYFKSNIVNYNLANEMYEAINKLRLNNGSLGKSTKYNDINTVLELYKKYKEDNSLIDRVDAIEMALENFKCEKNVQFAALENIEAEGIERELLEKYMEKGIVISTPNVEAIAPPVNCVYKAENEKADNPWGKVYGKKPEKLNVKLWSGYGKKNEVKYIARKIIEDKLQLGNVAILYTAPIYADEINTLFKSLKIDVTFAQGIANAGGDAVSFIEDLKLVYDNCFRVPDLLKIMDNRCYDIAGKSIIRSALNNTFEKIYDGKENVKFGIEKAIDKRIAAVKEKTANITSLSQVKENKPENTEAGLLAIKEKFNSFIDAIATLFALSDEKEFYIQMIDLLNNYGAKKVSSADIQKYFAILRGLDTLLQNTYIANTSGNSFNINTVMGKIYDMAKSINVLADKEKPNCVFVDTISNLNRVTRSEVFIVGLNSESFPGKENESPILFDSEKNEIGINIQNNEQYKLYKLLEGLSLVQGNIYLGYNYYNTEKLCKDNMASFLYKVKSIIGDSAVIEKVGYRPIDNKPISQEEKYLCNLSDEDKKKRKVKATVEEDKLKVDFSAKEGEEYNVEDSIPWYKVGLSASKLDTLVTCPLEYYYENLLSIKKNEEKEYRYDKWLQNNELGIVVHSIAEDWVNYYLETKNTDKDKLDKIIQSKIAEIDSHFQVVTNISRENDIKTITEISNSYIDKIIAELDNFVPVAAELGFGREGGTVKDSVDENFTITVKNGNEEKNIKITGSIDRVDENQADHSFRIVDYKTGDGNKFDGKKNAHLLMQDYVYLLAFEKLLKLGKYNNINKAAQVTASRYHTKNVLVENEINNDFREEKNHFLWSLLSRLENGNYGRLIDEDLGALKSDYIEGTDFDEMVENKANCTKDHCSYCDCKELCDAKIWKWKIEGGDSNE